MSSPIRPITRSSATSCIPRASSRQMMGIEQIMTFTSVEHDVVDPRHSRCRPQLRHSSSETRRGWSAPRWRSLRVSQRRSADVPKGIETFDAAWTIIRDTHFDKTFNGVDWNAVRTELRPAPRRRRRPASLRGSDQRDALAPRPVAFCVDSLVCRASRRCAVRRHIGGDKTADAGIRICGWWVATFS